MIPFVLLDLSYQTFSLSVPVLTLEMKDRGGMGLCYMRREASEDKEVAQPSEQAFLWTSEQKWGTRREGWKGDCSFLLCAAGGPFSPVARIVFLRE